MLQERNLGVALLGFGLATSACVTALPAQRPNDTFATEDGPVVGASDYEKDFLDDINKELVKQGWQPATPGEYEMKAAQIVARAAFEQRWSSSGVKSSPPDATSEKPLHAWVPTKAPKPPVAQYAVAYGIVPDFGWFFNTSDYSTRHLADDDLEDLVRTLRPLGFAGQARVGVSVLPDPTDGHRIFAAVMRDERVSISKGVPRVATPGSTISIEGKLVAQDLKPNLWVLHPDAKIDESPVTMNDNGSFSATYTLPSVPGLYLLSLSGNTGYEVPTFSGVEPTPWPPRPADDAAPPADLRDAASQIIKALEDWRVRHGMALLPVRADLCAAAKAESTLFGAAMAKNRGTPLDTQGMGSQAERLRAAGIDPSRTSVMNLTWKDDDFIYNIAWFPDSPSILAKLASPNAEALGIGVTYVPRDSLDDPTLYRVVWMISSAATPIPAAPPAAAPTPAPAEPPKAKKLEPSTPNEKKASEVGHTSEEAPTLVPAPEKTPETAAPAPAK